MRLSPYQAKWVVGLVAVGAYANSIANGFALDDNWFIALNPVVTEARFSDAFQKPAWPQARQGTGNYRPITLSSFAIEWSLWGGAPLPFHLVSILAHAAVSLLVLALLSRYLALAGALAGALFFAVHPVHTEAVANVMGRAELYAAGAYLGACLVYLAMTGNRPVIRGMRLTLLVCLFLLALGAKEIAVTLPGTLIALETFRSGDRSLSSRLRREIPTMIALGGVLVSYILVRWSVLGDLTGDSPAAGLDAVSGSERILTALSVWPHYLRLMVFPLDLVADYSPGVLLVTRTVSTETILGALLLMCAVGGTWLLRRQAPAAALGFAWFLIAVIPVSNLVVQSDVLLAERTLYLPSVGAAFVVGAVFAELRESAWKRSVLAGAVACGVLLTARTIQRNPTWKDTFTVVNTLWKEHPEAWLALRWRGAGLHEVGDIEAATEAYELALEVAGDHYGLVVDVAEFYTAIGDFERSEELLNRAVQLLPTYPIAYRRLAEGRLRQLDGRGAHRVALRGLQAAGADAELFASLSESYVAKGDLEAAARARRASLAHNPSSSHGWGRLAELLEALGRDAEAAQAESNAVRLRAKGGAAS